MESLDAYSFGTLWQEATQSIGYTWSALMGGLSDIFGTRAYCNAEQTKSEEQRKITNYETLARSGRSGNAILGLGLVALIALIAYVIYTNKNK